MTTIDRLDAELLRLLAADPRCGVLDLAQQLGVTRNTAQARLARLQSSGLVTGWLPVVDLATLGFTVRALVELELAQGGLTEVVEQLATLANVLEVLATTGSADLIVRIAARTHEEAQHLLQQLLALPGVVRTRTLVILSTPVTHRVQPLLDHVTEGTGRGRAGD